MAASSILPVVRRVGQVGITRWGVLLLLPPLLRGGVPLFILRRAPLARHAMHYPEGCGVPRRRGQCNVDALVVVCWIFFFLGIFLTRTIGFPRPVVGVACFLAVRRRRLFLFLLLLRVGGGSRSRRRRALDGTPPHSRHRVRRAKQFFHRRLTTLSCALTHGGADRRCTHP